MSNSPNVIRWESLVSETQFATDQVISGVKELARVANPKRYLFEDSGSSVRYKLHNGLLQYTTGLERLAKLTIITDVYRRTGAYPPVKSLGHDISNLLNRITKIDMSEFQNLPYVAKGHPQVPVDLLPVLTEYAKGGGRYEFLDSLEKADTAPVLYRRWINMANGYNSSSGIRSQLELPKCTAATLYKISNWIDSDLETIFQPYIDTLETEFDETSVAIALDCLRLARWVTSYLSALSYGNFYDRSGKPQTAIFPDLREVLDREFLHSGHDLIEFHILPFEDCSTASYTLDTINQTISDEESGIDQEPMRRHARTTLVFLSLLPVGLVCSNIVKTWRKKIHEK